MRLIKISNVRAVTFDDYFTLRYSLREQEDIIFPILRALKKERISPDDDEFLKQYFEEDKRYRKRLKETLRESTLDDIVTNALRSSGYESEDIRGIIRKAVDFGLATRKTRWFPNVKKTLTKLRKKRYRLGLISNTHWRIADDAREEFEKFFDVITLSYEHGYAKPYPSIFLTTVERLGVKANQCLHVGDDRIADVQGAQSAGMKAVFIKRKNVRTDADIEIRRIGELEALLRRFRAVRS